MFGCSQVSRVIGEFGTTIEQLLIKYGKTIVDEQFLLNRVADASIDIYGMVAVLSRATRSLKRGDTSALYEAMICDVYCDEVFDLCVRYLF